jgi:hypothetical protein
MHDVEQKGSSKTACKWAWLPSLLWLLAREGNFHAAALAGGLI